MQALENDFCPGGAIIFFSCRAYKLGDDEYSASVFGIEYCIQILYLAFPKISINYFCKRGGGSDVREITALFLFCLL